MKPNPLSQRAVAKALGISRTWLQVLEHRALVKVAAATGGFAVPLPKWMGQYASATRTEHVRDVRRKRLKLQKRAARSRARSRREDARREPRQGNQP
jgi:hypothetical protein